MPTRRAATPLAEHRAAGATALLINDMISGWRFEDAGKLLPRAAAIAPRIAALARRCRAAGVPVIYANDNHGMWRSDFRQVVETSMENGGVGARITAQLAPDANDYFVLKPKHSAFFQTPLHLLLQHLEASRLIVTGVASDQCVVATAFDARMRDLEVIVPRDCIASQTPQRDRLALAHFEEALRIRTTPSGKVRLPRPTRS